MNEKKRELLKKILDHVEDKGDFPEKQQFRARDDVDPDRDWGALDQLVRSGYLFPEQTDHIAYLPTFAALGEMREHTFATCEIRRALLILPVLKREYGDGGLHDKQRSVAALAEEVKCSKDEMRRTLRTMTRVRQIIGTWDPMNARTFETFKLTEQVRRLKPEDLDPPPERDPNSLSEEEIESMLQTGTVEREPAADENAPGDNVAMDRVYALNRNARTLLVALHHEHLKAQGAWFAIGHGDDSPFDFRTYRAAAQRLVQKGLAKWAGQTEVTSTAYGIQVAENSAILDELLPVGTTSQPRGTGARSMAPTTTRIFISHSSADAEVARALINLIKAGLEVPTGAIRCTSVDGYKLEGGDDAPEVLRENLKGCNVVLGVLTKRSLSSSYVLMELGAAWAFRKRAIPLFGPGATFKDLPGPFKDIHGLKMDHAPDMASMIETIGKETGFAKVDNMAEVTSLLKVLTDMVTAQGASEVVQHRPFAPDPVATPALAPVAIPAPVAPSPVPMHDDEAKSLLETWLENLAENVHSRSAPRRQIIPPNEVASQSGVPEPKVVSLLEGVAFENEHLGVTVKKLQGGKFDFDIGPARVRQVRNRRW